MIRYIKQGVVLTSESPEAFINFVYEPSDTSVWYIIPQQDLSASDGLIFVNGLDINGGPDPSVLHYEPSINYALIVDYDGDPSIASFIVSTSIKGSFDYNLKFDVYDVSAIDGGTSPLETIEVSIFNKPFLIPSSAINSFDTTNVQVDGEASYLLVRTNPKYSGNIKLVADSSNRLYLDTFKISDILSNKKYRKQNISGESYLSGDIRRVFEGLPEGELYRLDDENTLDIKIPKTDFHDQFDLNYSYGARLFKDELYSEDYALLAPLWINKDLPSYFAVFRLDGVYNPETYTGSNLNNLGDDYISNGELVTTWSIKETSPIGTYLRNHTTELLKNRAPVFLSLTDPDAVDYDPNTWYGIAVDKGIITGRSEVPYFFNQKTHNFTDMNAFVSAGFERNNLLCPNLINMEFAFDDEDAEPWTIEARGKRFTPPRKTTLSPYSFAWKSLIYSPDRVLYPMKRVDFDPKGDRHCGNRGLSGYERISWEEALDMVAAEIKRVKREYGPGSIMNGCGSHHMWGTLGYWLSARLRFFNSIGFTPVASNPDSWEGWYWGACRQFMSGSNRALG